MTQPTRKGRKRCFNAEQVAYICSEYSRGCTMEGLALEFNVSTQTIQTYIKEAGVERRNNGPRPVVTEDLLKLTAKLRSEGVIWAEVAKKLGVSITSLRRAHNHR